MSAIASAARLGGSAAPSAEACIQSRRVLGGPMSLISLRPVLFSPPCHRRIHRRGGLAFRNAATRKAKEVPEGIDADTWQSFSPEQKEEFLEMYGIGGQANDEDERRRRLSERYSDVLIQQYRTEVTTTQFVEAGQTLQDRLMEAIRLEAEEQEQAMEHLYESGSTKRLKQQGLCLTDLKAKRRGQMYSDFLYDLGPFPEGEFHRFQRGDNIVVSMGLLENGDPLALVGVVSEVRPTSIQIAVEREASVALDDQGPKALWRLDQKLTDASAMRQKEALQQLPKFREENNQVMSAGQLFVKAAILGLPCAEELAGLPTSWAQDKQWRVAAAKRLEELGGLNTSQRKAIASALTRSMSLWQGPPGTGKTRTMMTFIDVLCYACNSQQAWRESIGQILVVADTNAAVDNLLEGLLERGLSVVRVGNPAKVRDDLRGATLEAMAEKSARGKTAARRRAQSEQIRAEAEAGAKAKPPLPNNEIASMHRAASDEWKAATDLMRDAIAQQLDESQVVLCTCSGAGSQMMKNRKFKIVLIDEATQATEPSTLVPLMKGAECCVLAGDPRQLPPTVVSSAAVAAGLSETLFARLEANTDIPVLLLNTQYRMHPAINKFPSAKFYSNKVQSGIPPSARPPPLGVPWPSKGCPVALVKCKGKESTSSVSQQDGSSGSSYANVKEAGVVMRVVKSILAAEDDIDSVAILTPYNGQVRLFKRLVSQHLSSDMAKKVRISSVDGFQGQEADAVVFSTVRCNDAGNMGFVADLRRMNVAITRARRGLIVVGHPQTLATNKYWRQWIGFMQKVGSILSPSDFPELDQE